MSINTDVLVRTHPLSAEEWEVLIMERYGIVKPYLEDMGLIEMGKLELLQNDQGFSHNLASDKPILKGGFALETDGIFGLQNLNDIEYQSADGYSLLGAIPMKGGRVKFWGITRSGTWILGTVEFDVRKGYQEQGVQRALVVNVREARIAEILAETKLKAERIWRKLGEVIRQLEEDARKEHLRLLEFAHLVWLEEDLVSKIPKS